MRSCKHPTFPFSKVKFKTKNKRWSAEKIDHFTIKG